MPTFEQFHIVLLVSLYAKNEKLDLTAVERLKIRGYLERQRRALSEGRYS